MKKTLAAMIMLSCLSANAEPVVSGWDGSLPLVEKHNQTLLKNYSSARYLKWGRVIPVGGDRDVVTCVIEAENSFGGRIVVDMAYIITSDKVLVGGTKKAMDRYLSGG